jgi:cation:H+ antiporter
MFKVMMYLLLLVGFALLIKGADFFVEGSSSVAKLLGIPSVVIGLTIVAMGTSAPEAAVSITAGLAGSNAIAVSNVVGSNLFNLLVVAGTCAAIKAFPLEHEIIKRDFPVNIFAVILLPLLCLDGTLGRLDGILLLVLMATYLVTVVRSAMKNRQTAEEEIKTLSPLMSFLFIVGGLACIVIGGDLVVDNAVLIAQSWGLSETFIGLTIIAMGTSLPELVTSVVAACKGESGLALGNVVGSNIFNLFLILGLSSSLHPITIAGDMMLNAIVMGVATILFFLIALPKKQVSRFMGFASVAVYLCYTVYLVLAS